MGQSAPATAQDKPQPAALPLAGLKPGLSTAAVLKLLGKPNEIKPMKAPDGKAEVWVYTRELDTHVERIGFPSADIITFVIGADGKPIEQKMPGPVRCENVQHITEENTEVLMFNDQYVVHKVSRSKPQIH